QAADARRVSTDIERTEGVAEAGKTPRHSRPERTGHARLPIGAPADDVRESQWHNVERSDVRNRGRAWVRRDHVDLVAGVHEPADPIACDRAPSIRDVTEPHAALASCRARSIAHTKPSTIASREYSPRT